MDVVKSKNNVPIRVPSERWLHITEEHSELAGYYFDVLEAVEEGNSGEYLAVRHIGGDKHIVVAYREVNINDGFVITAFLTKRSKEFERKRRLWERLK